VALLRSDRAVQSIRACALPAGAAVLFSHRVMHWGSRGHPRCTTPRFSLSFGCADPSFERPYLKAAASHLPFPRPAVRAALAAAQLINYHERFAFGAPLLSLFGRVFRAHRSEFTAEYAHKTAAELKSAAEDRARAAAASAVAVAGGVGGGGVGGGGGGGGGGGVGVGEYDNEEEDDDEEDDAMDDALDAMLEAQMEAEGNLFDDFAELQGQGQI